MTKPSPSPHTLAYVLERLDGIGDLSDQARRNMVSSVRTLCRVIDRAPRFVMVSAPALRTVFRDASPGLLRLSPSRWANVKSDVRRAVRLTCVLEESMDQVPLSAAWEDLVMLEEDVNRRCALRRFGRFCSALQCEPLMVTDEVVDAFCWHLDETGLSKMPERITRDLIRFWMALDERQGLGLPCLAKRSTDNRYSFAWSALPKALAEDARAFREARINPSPFTDLGCPVRRTTADKQDRMLRQLASAAIHGGVAREEVQSLADLCRPGVAQAALTFLMERAGGDKGPQVSDMAHLIHTVARVWCGVPEADLKVLKRFSHKLHHRQDGMTGKNRERLRALVSPMARHALVTLPDRLQKKALGLPASYKSAMLMQKAVAIGILLVAPVRLGNLLTLDRQVHFLRALSGHDGWQLFHAAPDVKNGVDLHLPLPNWLMKMVDLYMEHYQPLLTGNSTCSLLFPSRNGGLKHDSGLRGLIRTTVLKEAGLHVNPHLFRHFSALLFLGAHPGQYESVRQLLGHRNIQTTYSFYACFEQDMAGRIYNDVIERERQAGSELQARDGRLPSPSGSKLAVHEHGQPHPHGSEACYKPHSPLEPWRGTGHPHAKGN